MPVSERQPCHPGAAESSQGSTVDMLDQRTEQWTRRFPREGEPQSGPAGY